MASLNLEGINKVYDNKVQAVFDFNLDIKDGEFIVLVGPSGCGKSTTLRMIAGLEEISSGNLSIDGADVTEAAAKNRDVAMVFQNYALYAHMTVYENMAFSLMLRKEDPDITHEKVMSAAEILGLADQLGKKPAQLSGGQRQRVAVGRAMVRDPKVFLFDEPLSNLDAKLRGSMRRELRLLHNRLKATTIYVTHDQIEALTLADRIVVMNEGRVQQVGSPAELYDRPVNLFVASFLGLPPMNFLEVSTDNNEFDFGGVKLPFPGNAERGIYKGERVIIGVRPEDIFPSPDGIPLKVVINENLGQNTLVHGLIAGKRVTAKFRRWCDYKNGEVVNVRFNHEKTHVFNKETGMAVRGKMLEKEGARV